jgi:hypothetical protein
VDNCGFEPTLGDIKLNHSPVNLLGKLIFRHRAPWEQRQKAAVLFWSITLGLLSAGSFAGALLLTNTRH